MLHYKVVDGPTLDLLIKINDQALFQSYRLVGGTALALLRGHRKSIDLDLFGNQKIDTFHLIHFLKTLGAVRGVQSSGKIDSLFCNDVKIDIVHYQYDWIDAPMVKNELRLASTKEIAAMKIAAIINRGTKKDFIDLNELLTIYSFKQIIDFYVQKYKDGSVFFAIKSIVYFNDAEEQEMPIMFHDITWEQVKTNIKQAQSSYLLDEADGMKNIEIDKS